MCPSSGVRSEGFKDQAPVLAGLLCDDQFVQHLFAPEFKGAACSGNLQLPICAKTALNEIVEKCRRESRFLICYSEHELKVLKEHFGIDASDVYFDARAFVKRWINRFHRKMGVSHWTLAEILRFCNYYVPVEIGEGQTTRRLRYVRDMLSTNGGSFRRLTDGAKDKWRLVISHNRHDCYGMRRAVMRAAKCFASLKLRAKIT